MIIEVGSLCDEPFQSFVCPLLYSGETKALLLELSIAPLSKRYHPLFSVDVAYSLEMVRLTAGFGVTCDSEGTMTLETYFCHNHLHPKIRKGGTTLTPKRNKVSKQVADQTSTHTYKNSPTSNTTGKERDAIIPTKDKSPDDLEIPD